MEGVPTGLGVLILGGFALVVTFGPMAAAVAVLCFISGFFDPWLRRRRPAVRVR